MSVPEPNVPYGYCHCGCGEKTTIAPRNRSWLGHVKGEPIPYVSGHNVQKHRPPPDMPKTKLCDCGCGRPAPIAKQTRAEAGRYKGYASRFISGHQGRRQVIDSFHEEDRGHDTPCWIWELHRDEGGYGRTRNRPAHCVVYEERVGLIPDGLQLDHLCRVRECVNPDHLEPVTHLENVRRSRRAKLTLEKAVTIRRDLARGVSRRELADRYEVSLTTIGSIAKYETWRED